MTKPIWTPSAERVRNSNMRVFFDDLGTRHQILGRDYRELHHWSVARLETFWEEAWQDAGVAVSAPHTAVLTDRSMPAERKLPREAWFPGTRFNFAQHLLRWRDARPALIAETERGERRRVSYRELYDLTARCTAALRRLGVGPGDRVAGYLPNTVETVVAMLGTAALGAIWSSTSPDFGYQGVRDRFGQIDPKVLICADGYHYGGKVHDSLENAARLPRAIPSIEQLVVVPFVDSGAPLPAGSITWEAFLGAEPAPEPEFPHFPFDQPLFILYSSGTTGVPKCLVHGAGGTLLKHHVEHKLHTDLRRDDVLFYYTTCGWMMWNWLASGLAQGCTLVLYDGSPAYPEADRLFRLAEETGITVFGTSPKFLAGCAKTGLVPRERMKLASLRTILSTGAPLEPNQFHYVHEAIKADVQLASIAGGTDLIGCFMLGNPLSPVHAGEIQGPALGMDVTAFDEQGQPVLGARGELVCRAPFPSMPIYFWADPDGAKYRRAYFEDYPGVWRHGDFITITEQGGVIVHGRSDTTLNPGGVRIGTAEIYRIVETLPFVNDSIVVGHPIGGEPQVVLFVVLRDGLTLDGGLEEEIRRAIRSQASPRHLPAVIRQIAEVPVTVNGKKVELAVAGLLRGEPVKNKDALANPDALKQFEGLGL
ncbi:MAG: acetoacetate--CoA ligase [SAR324 cluster bacterium]|nr:acetoacetate--CoA ligase [SAR324 cluster bacterium]